VWEKAMGLVLSVTILVLLIGLGVFIWLYSRSLKALERYGKIQDAEEYVDDCAKKAATAQAQCQRLNRDSQKYQSHISELKQTIDRYSNVVGKFKSLDEMGQKISQQTQELDALSATIGQVKTASEIAAQTQYYENYLAQLKTDVAVVEETRDLQEFGYYEPRYDFDSSEQYKHRLDSIKNQQKRMLKDKIACKCETEWTVEGSKQQGRKMVNEQIKLMLRAFNGECDAAVSKVKYNNAVSLGNRIEKSFEQINKLGATKQTCVSSDYLHARLEELYLSHEYQVTKQDEREEQRRIREMMREEEKVVKEIEKATKDAEKEETLRANALDQARRDLAQLEGKNTLKMEQLVAKLENELQAALDRKAKAIARAQLTRSGHVYVLSNVGTFGEGVYKVGLTRRLEPLERVKELSGASVPFPFDVHAMIYSEDAPALENALHKYFSSRRVNMVNLRREFFRISLDEVRAAVAKLHGQVTFVLEPEAEQYRQTIAMQREQPAARPLLIG
jgi:uncharacterized protein YoxC